jgi:hypothetical protein
MADMRTSEMLSGVGDGKTQVRGFSSSLSKCNLAEKKRTDTLLDMLACTRQNEIICILVHMHFGISSGNLVLV